MGQQPSVHCARLMGAWIVDMTDLDVAHTAIASCRRETDVALEVRHTLWGVQVRTDDEGVASVLADCYVAQAKAVTLAA